MPTEPHDVAAPGGSDALDDTGAPYVQQPVDGERPLPLRGRPERAQDPGAWESDSTEPIRTRANDAAAEELARHSENERAAHAEGRAGERTPGDNHESSYSSEQEQGAAQPGPADE